MTVDPYRMIQSQFVSAIVALRGRQSVVIVENSVDYAVSGAVVFAAQFADARNVATMVRETSGFICVAMTGPRLDTLMIPPQHAGHAQLASGFGVSVDLRHNEGTGISARDRAETIRALADARTSADDLVRPGHVVPVNADASHCSGFAAAAVRLCVAAGLDPAAAFATVVDPVGDVAGMEHLRTIADHLEMPLIPTSAVIGASRVSEQAGRHTGICPVALSEA